VQKPALQPGSEVPSVESAAMSRAKYPITTHNVSGNSLQYKRQNQANGRFPAG